MRSRVLIIAAITCLSFVCLGRNGLAAGSGRLLCYTDTGISPNRVDSLPAQTGSKTITVRGTCKGYRAEYPTFSFAVIPVEILPATKKIVSVQSTAPIPLLRVTGNILYDVDYRSRIDTPYAENSIYQHTVQTRLDFVYKDQYPFRLYLTTRFGNSSLFRKYTDLNFHYVQSDFSRLMKNRLIGAMESYMASKTARLDSLRRLIDQKKADILSLHRSVEKPDLSQRMVEQKEKDQLRRQPGNALRDSLSALANIQRLFSSREKYKFSSPSKSDTTAGSENKKGSKEMQAYHAYKDSIGIKKQKLDSLTNELAQLENAYEGLRSVQQLKRTEWRKEIEEAKDANVLTQKMHELDMPDSLLPKGYKTLYAVKSFGIGRSMANYSELSVKNISITGLQVEYNPHYYYAFAAGKVDYRFRDYIIPNQTRSDQYVGLVRFGKGTRNGNHLIFTYYTGRRQFFNGSVALQPNSPVPEYNLAGFTVEGLYKLGKTTSVIAEAAKSTSPYYSPDSLQKRGWMNSVTRFKDRTNEAYSVRLYSYFPGTQTRFTGNVRYIGANFQSFSTFTTGAAQTTWLARIEQPFFKKKLTIVSSVQQNDYSNPFVATAYKSSSVLTSFQAMLRIKKWPFLSVGYYPSYQLIKIDDNNYTEDRYYTLVANTGYYYQVHDAQLSTTILYSRFYNESSDSGFVYFNSKNLLVSQNISFGRYSVAFNLSASINTGYNIYTLENSDQFSVNRFITVGAGIKMIRQTLFNRIQWGNSGNLTVKIPRLGDIQLMMDNGFIPGLNKQLVENRMGRLTYFKTF